MVVAHIDMDGFYLGEAAVAELYEACAYCGRRIDFAGAAIVLRDDPADASYEPFMEDWRGGFVKVAHPRCFAEHEGIDALLEAAARNDRRQRGSQ